MFFSKFPLSLLFFLSEILELEEYFIEIQLKCTANNQLDEELLRQQQQQQQQQIINDDNSHNLGSNFNDENLNEQQIIT